jgi:hypothetical protein
MRAVCIESSNFDFAVSGILLCERQDFYEGKKGIIILSHRKTKSNMFVLDPSLEHPAQIR